MSATPLLAELHAAGITVHADDGQLRLDAPTGAMAPGLLASVKSCKAELLKVLNSTGGPGVGSDSSGVDSYADREWERFLSVAVETPDGRGWHDPSESPEMPSGIPGEQWDQFVADFAHLGKRGGS